MNKALIFLIFLISSINMTIFIIKIKPKAPEPKRNTEFIQKLIPKEPPKLVVPVQPEKPKIEPQFIEYRPLRNPDTSLGKVLSDVDSHLPQGHIYRDNDRITFCHESTHGVNSDIRNKNQRGKRINGFYLLENKAVIIEEPNTTIRSVASRVPSSLRGGVYNLYLIESAGSWNDTPLYIFDEWSAYTNGSICRLDLGIKNRSETILYMLEFNVYSSCVAWASGSNDQQLKSFLMWQIERTMKVYKDSANLGNLGNSDSYLQKMRTSSDASNWRAFCKSYFGNEWCRDTLGF